MKNIKILLASLMLATFIISCDTDGGSSQLDLQEGAIPNFTLNTDFPTILNLNELSAGNDIDFGFTVDIEQGNVSSADVVAFYRTAGGEVYGPVTLRSDITEFPTDITLSASDVIAAFPELNSLDDFQLADELVISTKLLLQDGRELDLLDDEGRRLYGSDIHTSSLFNVVASYPVGCPLNGRFTGDYRVTVSGPTGPFGVFSPAEFTATLAETSQTLRTFSLTYLPDIGGFPVDATLEFVCDKVLLNGDSGVGCGGGAITFGSTDEGTSIDFDEDESGFTITITDFLTDGGCGVGPRDITLNFEKL